MKKNLIAVLLSMSALAAISCIESQSFQRKAPMHSGQEAILPPSTDYF